MKIFNYVPCAAGQASEARSQHHEFAQLGVHSLPQAGICIPSNEYRIIPSVIRQNFGRQSNYLGSVLYGVASYMLREEPAIAVESWSDGESTSHE